MDLRFSTADQQRLAAFCETMHQNARITYLYSQYLNNSPTLLTKEFVETFARDCELSHEDAFLALFAAAIGLECDVSAEDRRLDRIYLQQGVRKCDPQTYLENAYVQAIRFPSESHGAWSFTLGQYRPYEPFPCGHPIQKPDGREIPRIGFFTEPFSFPAVLENGQEWMSLKPNEIETMREPLARCFGNAVTFGLGLGYFAFCASEKPSVTSLTVVERDATLIELFRTHLLPQFPHREKIRIVESDAFAYMENRMPREGFDFSFMDLWHDASDGLELYLRAKKLEALSPNTEFTYWIEPSLRSYLRNLLFERALPENYASFEEYLKALE